MAGKLQGAFLALGFQACVTVTSFLRECQDLNSGPCHGVASALLTELS